MEDSIFGNSFGGLSFFRLASGFFLLLFRFDFSGDFIECGGIFRFLISFGGFRFRYFSGRCVVITSQFGISLEAQRRYFSARCICSRAALDTTLSMALSGFFIFRDDVGTVPEANDADFSIERGRLSFFIFLVFSMRFCDVAGLRIEVMARFVREGSAI